MESSQYEHTKNVMQREFATWQHEWDIIISQKKIGVAHGRWRISLHEKQSDYWTWRWTALYAAKMTQSQFWLNLAANMKKFRHPRYFKDFIRIPKKYWAGILMGVPSLCAERLRQIPEITNLILNKKENICQ